MATDKSKITIDDIPANEVKVTVVLSPGLKFRLRIMSLLIRIAIKVVWKNLKELSIDVIESDDARPL